MNQSDNTAIPKSISLDWTGPYFLTPDQNGSRPLVYEQEKAESAGIYLWLMEIEDKHYLYYVGVAGQSSSIAQRQRQHMRGYLSGLYTIYDAVAFSKGNKERPIYWNQNRNSMGNFIANIEGLHNAAVYMASCMEVYLAPLNIDRATLEHIESALISGLRAAGGDACRVLDNERISRRTLNGEQIRICTANWPAFAGKPDSLSVPG